MILMYKNAETRAYYKLTLKLKVTNILNDNSNRKILIEFKL